MPTKFKVFFSIVPPNPCLEKRCVEGRRAYYMLSKKEICVGLDKKIILSLVWKILKRGAWSSMLGYREPPAQTLQISVGCGTGGLLLFDMDCPSHGKLNFRSLTLCNSAICDKVHISYIVIRGFVLWEWMWPRPQILYSRRLTTKFLYYYFEMSFENCLSDPS